MPAARSGHPRFEARPVGDLTPAWVGSEVTIPRSGGGEVVGYLSDYAPEAAAVRLWIGGRVYTAAPHVTISRGNPADLTK